MCVHVCVALQHSNTMRGVAVVSTPPSSLPAALQVQSPCLLLGDLNSLHEADYSPDKWREITDVRKRYLFA